MRKTKLRASRFTSNGGSFAAFSSHDLTYGAQAKADRLTSALPTLAGSDYKSQPPLDPNQITDFAGVPTVSWAG